MVSLSLYGTIYLISFVNFIAASPIPEAEPCDESGGDYGGNYGSDYGGDYGYTDDYSFGGAVTTASADSNYNSYEWDFGNCSGDDCFDFTVPCSCGQGITAVTISSYSISSGCTGMACFEFLTIPGVTIQGDCTSIGCLASVTISTTNNIPVETTTQNTYDFPLASESNIEATSSSFSTTTNVVTESDVTTGTVTASCSDDTSTPRIESSSSIKDTTEFQSITPSETSSTAGTSSNSDSTTPTSSDSFSSTGKFTASTYSSSSYYSSSKIMGSTSTYNTYYSTADTTSSIPEYSEIASSSIEVTSPVSEEDSISSSYSYQYSSVTILGSSYTTSSNFIITTTKSYSTVIITKSCSSCKETSIPTVFVSTFSIATKSDIDTFSSPSESIEYTPSTPSTPSTLSSEIPPTTEISSTEVVKPAGTTDINTPGSDTTTTTTLPCVTLSTPFVTTNESGETTTTYIYTTSTYSFTSTGSHPSVTNNPSASSYEATSITSSTPNSVAEFLGAANSLTYAAILGAAGWLAVFM